MNHRRNGTETTAFRDWLLAELADRDWRRVDLQRAINANRRRQGLPDVHETSVGKWLRTPDDVGEYRVPSYQSCLDIADALQVDRDLVLRLSGRLTEAYDRDERTMTALQRDAVATIRLLEDDLLETLLPQLRALVRVQVQREAKNRNLTKEPVLSGAG